MNEGGVKRFRRGMLNALAAVSAVLCIGAIALWVRSYWDTDGFYTYKYLTLDGRETYTSRRFQYDGPPTAIGIHVIVRSTGGHILFSRSRYKIDFSPAHAKLQWFDLPIVGKHYVAPSFLGFRWQRMENSKESSQELWIPLWFIAGITAIPGAMWLNRLRYARLDAGQVHCSMCGYDLRATPERCPECGT